MMLDVLVGDLIAVRHDVGAIDREAGCDFADGAANLGAREVALVAAGLADLDEEGGEAVDVAAESLLRDVDLLVVREDGERRCVAGELCVVLAELVAGHRA